MKKLLFLVFLFITSVFSQTAFGQTSGSQFDYIKSNLSDLKDEGGNNIVNSTYTDSLVFNGEAPTNYFGRNVSNAGDVNGDGYSDLIVSAPNYGNSIGKVYIYFGGLSMDNIADVTMTGETTNSFGYSISTAGDLNDDGYSDIIIGAPDINITPTSRKAYIFFGGSSMDNLADVIISIDDINFAYCVSSAGDVNGDGYSDVIVSYYLENKAYIYYGGSSMDNIQDIILTGSNGFGYTVSNAGDVNGDSYSDVIIGNMSFSAGPGQVFIFYGGSSMDNIADVTLSEAANNYFGYSFSSAGDLNGDGYSDVIVGALGYNSGDGGAYIYYGGASINNVADIILQGEATHNYFGNSVSSAGDVNGDGYSDVIVGSNNYNNEKGRAYVFYGGSAMNNVVDLTMTGETINSNFGVSVSSAGDVNGDGYSDLIVGAYNYANGKGRAYLYANLMPKPQLVNPSNYSMNNPLTINFKWKKFNPAVYYVLHVSTDSAFYNIVVNDTIPVDTFKTVTGFLKGIKYFWRVKAKDTLGVTPVNSIVWNFTTIQPLYFNAKLLFEGMYSPAFNQLIRKDSVTSYLHQSTPPFNIIDSAKASIDSLSFTGLFKFFNAPSGTYYISVKHLNSIETWSKAGSENLATDGTIYNYDFTTANTQAYGNNLKLKGSKYCLYTGDMNHDGYIDLFDLVPIFNDASNFVAGRYLPADLNGDSIVDLTDITLCSNNSINFVQVIRP